MRIVGTIGAAIACALTSTSSLAVQLQCTEDKRTNAMQCVAPTEVRESAGSIRYAPLYTGGPNQITKTSFTIHTNCSTGVTHLKDRAGVSFAGGDGYETKAVRELRQIVCEAAVKPGRR